MGYVLLYLLAVVLANLSSARFGASASIINAFLFIGLDLTSRDKLHDAWHHENLVPKMFALIGVGSVLSYVVSLVFMTAPADVTAKIAMASAAAFLASGLVDAVIYHLLRDKARLLRVNGSNVPSALVDSLVFPTLAFGSFLPAIVAGQFLAKVTGGFIWSLLLNRPLPQRLRNAPTTR